MIIYLENKHTLQVDDFKLKCCVGKRGLTIYKKEGDKKTPKGLFGIGELYYRKDRINKLETSLKCIEIKKNMGWCDDPLHYKYNQLVKIKKTFHHEKLYRKDYKYDLLIPINYNTKKTKPNLGSAIFLHLTKSFKPTLGCIALKESDFLILIKLISRKTKIKII